MTATQPHAGDEAVVTRAARTIALRITAAASTIVVLIVAVSVAFILDQSRPSELLEKPAPGETKIYIASGDMFTALVVTGVVAVILAGLLSWVIARRVVAPLGEALRIQRSFVADASHELRTPVAIISTRVEVLAQELEAGGDPHDDLAGLRRDVRALGEVITDLLLAASPVDGDTRADCPARPTVRAVLDDLAFLAGQNDVTLRLDGGEGLVAALPEATFRRCVVVLVDNAVKHSPSAGTIEVVLAPARRRFFELRVTDHGPGITGVDPARVFDRFSHGQQAPSGTAARRGFGIGLALVRDIAGRYGGNVAVAETSPAGTTFVLTLPLASPRDAR
ncbi:MAG TPA: HAMP domain-containing sensor histidine kinase [Microbacteriaceae bacterium]|nr:HAMP domain-containing sensor histidine kinase [Microbacteriaceae bacterium]